MTEQTDGLFGQRPIFGFGPQRGQLGASETGVNTNGRIMTSHSSAASEPQQSTAERRPSAAARFDRDQSVGLLRCFAEQRGELIVRELVQKEVRKDRVGLLRCDGSRPIAYILDDGLNVPLQCGESRERGVLKNIVAVYELC